MVDEGYAATQILSQLHDSIIEGDLNDKQKSAIAEKMAVWPDTVVPPTPTSLFFFNIKKTKVITLIFISVILQFRSRCTVI